MKINKNTNFQDIQWNLSTIDTIGSQHFVPYSMVSLILGFLVGVVCITTWLRFLSFLLLFAGR